MSETPEDEVFETGALKDGDDETMYVEDDIVSDDPEVDPDEPALDPDSTTLQDDLDDEDGEK